MLVEKILSEVNIYGDLISKKQLEIMLEYSLTGGVAIWGTGRAGSYAVDFCIKNGVQPVCVVDSFEHEEGSEFKEIPLLSSHAFFTKYPNALVVVACLFGYGIDKLLEKKGYRYLTFDVNFLKECIGMHRNAQECTSELPYCERIQKEKEKIDEVYALLTDEISKQTYERLIKYRLSFDCQYIEGMNLQPIYFENDVISVFSGNTFVDCGAFIGDTLRAFWSSKVCQCETYYALEPSHENFNRLQELIHVNKIPGAIPIEVGAWDREDFLHFSEGKAESCRITDEGETTIHVDSLDHLFLSKNIDFIKMDIEGAEKQAIIGAKNIIQTQSPILAVSIYHNSWDFWEIPLLIKSMSERYRMYVRHHSLYGDDTVLYCIPR